MSNPAPYNPFPTSTFSSIPGSGGSQFNRPQARAASSAPRKAETISASDDPGSEDCSNPEANDIV